MTEWRSGADVCCGDDNVTDTSVNGNDEITGEGGDGIEIYAYARGGAEAGGGWYRGRRLRW